MSNQSNLTFATPTSFWTAEKKFQSTLQPWEDVAIGVFMVVVGKFDWIVRHCIASV